MKKFKISAIQPIVISLILSFALLAFAGGLTFAAYTNSRYAQRTLATYQANGDKFSSNLLAKTHSRNNVKVVYTTNVELEPSALITICNYEQGRQSLPFERDVTYTIEAQFVKFDDSTDLKYVPINETYLSDNSLTSYWVTLRKGAVTKRLQYGTALSVTFGSSDGNTLTGNTTSSQVYTLTFSANFAANKPNLYVETIATPSDAALPTLKAIFKADIRSQGASNSWTGAFNDSDTYTPAQYDGYNYRISGVGSGTFTLRWDITKVDISDKSLLLFNRTPAQVGDTNYYQIVFPVDSDVESIYDVQFHKKNISAETWLQMNAPIDLEEDPLTVIEYSYAA